MPLARAKPRGPVPFQKLMVYEYRIGGAAMRVWLRRSVGLLAIYAIALTTILSTFSAPQPASAAFDPFSVICHSGSDAGATTDQAPSQQAPTKACDHCTLCGAASAALTGPDAIPAGRLDPPSVLHVLQPASSTAGSRFSASPHLPRGPPQRA